MNRQLPFVINKGTNKRSFAKHKSKAVSVWSESTLPLCVEEETKLRGKEMVFPSC